MSRKQLAVLFLSSFLSLSAIGVCAPVLAEDGAALDSMWIDNEAANIGGNDGTKTKSGPVASLHAGGALSAVAPMCSLVDFKASTFVSKVSWPGVGPFKASATESSEYIDDAQNHLKLGVAGEQVASAELGLSKPTGPGTRDFLDIQMSADFLLEALGAKPRKIAEFNAQLEKNREAVRKARAVSLTAGRYQVTIDRGQNAKPYSCLIAVNSLDAAKSLIKQHSGDDKGDDSATVAKVETPIQKLIPDILKRPILPKKPAVSATATTKPAASTTSTAPKDAKRDEFVSTIKGWQAIKKVALLKRDTAHLPDILGGAALAKQSTAVKWLQTNQKYYEMEPREAVVEKYTDLGGGKKYSVIAQVREFSKYIDETSNAVIKEVDDKYTVNYTMEKIGDKWMIIDSSVLKKGSETPAKVPVKPH